MNNKFEPKVALITGAGRGIGRELALSLADDGYAVAVCDLATDRASTVVDEIRDFGGTAVAAICDVTDGEAVRSATAAVVDRFGPISVLVNNAGIPVAEDVERESGLTKKQFAEGSPADWDRTLNLITYGVLNCTHAALQSMIGTGWGRVINIASDAGRIGERFLSCYSMAKAGVIGFSKALAKEVAISGITVNCVSPAFVVTQATSTRLDSAADKIMRKYPMARGLGRLGQPSDIAHAVSFLASDKSDWITGQVLSVNGGYCMVD